MITVFGSINLDLVAVVPRLPGPGETVSGPDHQSFPGGKGSNQAYAARLAGADVRLVGAVGTDAFAELALANLRAARVDLSGVRRLDGATGLAFIGVDPSGENQIIVASGANGRVSAEWLDDGLAKGDVLLVQGEVPGEELAKAIAMAKRSGMRTVFNPAPVPRPEFAGLARDVDVLIVNETEAAALAEPLGVSRQPKHFLAALAGRDKIGIVTLGSAGILAHDENDFIEIPAPEIDVVDSTGAGDAFCGALCAALDAGKSAETALAEAVAAGSLACRSTGAQSSAPSAGEISALAATVRKDLRRFTDR